MKLSKITTHRQTLAMCNEDANSVDVVVRQVLDAVVEAVQVGDGRQHGDVMRGAEGSQCLIRQKVHLAKVLLHQ